MKKIIIGIIVVLVLVGVVCFFNRTSAPASQDENIGIAPTMKMPTPEEAAKNSPTPEKVVTSEAKEFTIVGSSFAFTPSSIEVNQGDKVKIIFKNSGGMHDWKIDEFNAATKRIKAGEEGTIEFVADKTGTFEYYCSVGTHRAMGMKGTLVVK